MSAITYIEIEIAVSNYFGVRKHIIVPNVSWGFGIHECDLLLIKQSGYAFEVEIKMSKSDFVADFKKRHNHNDQRLQYLYYAIPSNIYEKCKDIVPEHAGLLVIHKEKDYAYVRLVKRPSKKKCRKLTTVEQLEVSRLGVLRMWNLKRQLKKTMAIKSKQKNEELQLKLF